MTARVTPAAPRSCPACERAPNAAFQLSNGEPLLRCPQCGLGWWSWAAFDPARFYDRDYFQSPGAARGYSDYDALEPGLRRTARDRLRRIRHWLGPGTGAEFALRDLGCGTGVFLEQARQAGYRVSGVEVSDHASGRARARGLDVVTDALETGTITPDTYDVITLWDVIEHLPDPASVTLAAARGLRPGGVLALSTGDLDSWCARLSGPSWHLFNLPEHLFFFTPRSLTRLLGRAGLVVRQTVHEVNWVPLRYVAERLTKTFTGRDRRLPLGFLGDRVVPATLGDVLGVYAVRPQVAD